MNRARLTILAAAGTVTTLAWGTVLVHSASDGGDGEVPAPPPASSSIAPAADGDGDSPHATVPRELRVPTIGPGGSGEAPRGGRVDDVADTPHAVGAVLVRIMWTYDTRIDTTSHDAAARAAGWATGDLAALLARPAIRTTPQWDEWARHHAYTCVDVQAAPTPGQDVDTAEHLRTFRVDVRVDGNDGYRDRLDPFLVTTTLVHDDGRWLVDGIALT